MSLLIVGVTVATGVVALPLSWYRTFVIEQRFGFNRMTLRLWLKPTSPRRALIGAALGTAAGHARALADGARRIVVVALRLAGVGRLSGCCCSRSIRRSSRRCSTSFSRSRTIPLKRARRASRSRDAVSPPRDCS